MIHNRLYTLLLFARILHGHFSLSLERVNRDNRWSINPSNQATRGSPMDVQLLTGQTLDPRAPLSNETARRAIFCASHTIHMRTDEQTDRRTCRWLSSYFVQMCMYVCIYVRDIPKVFHTRRCFIDRHMFTRSGWFAQIIAQPAPFAVRALFCCKLKFR